MFDPRYKRGMSLEAAAGVRIWPNKVNFCFHCHQPEPAQIHAGKATLYNFLDSSLSRLMIVAGPRRSRTMRQTSELFTGSTAVKIVNALNVTGFAKTWHNSARTEIHFIA